MRFLFLFVLLAAPLRTLHASGHGPVFGYATPTNSQGEWSFDVGLMGRNSAAGSDVALRSMLGYGFTPHLTLFLAAPAPLSTSSMPATRMMGGDAEGNLAWRFHRNAKGIGTRFESTAFAGIVMPGMRPRTGVMSNLRRAPGFNAALVSGVASRSHYFWVGGGFTRYLEREGTRRPDLLSYSLVYGYRPPALRKDYPSWDWRVFAELTGEKASRMVMGGVPHAGTASHQVFLGPSVLGIYKSFAISGGVQLPVYREVGALLPRERVRFAVNLSYFLFQRSHSH